MHLNTSSSSSTTTSRKAASLGALLLLLLLLTCAPSAVLAAPTPKDAKFFPDILDNPPTTGSQGDAAAGMMLNPSRIGVDRVELGLSRKITVDPVQVFGHRSIPVARDEPAVPAAEEEIETETEAEAETETDPAADNARLAPKSIPVSQKQNNLPHPKYIPKRRGFDELA